MKNARIPLIALILPLLLCMPASLGWGQNKDTALPQQGQRILEQRLEDYWNLLMKDCVKKIHQDARREVDSLLVSYDRLVDIDSFYLGNKPGKPGRPAFDFKVDSIRPEPIFRKDSLKKQ